MLFIFQSISFRLIPPSPAVMLVQNQMFSFHIGAFSTGLFSACHKTPALLQNYKISLYFQKVWFFPVF